jgi:hypothetical protein
MRRSRIEKGSPITRDWLGTDAKVVRHVRVCGDGHLAVATRIELNRLGIQRDSDYLLPSLRPALIIACADSEDDRSFEDAAQRAADGGSPLLFACLVGRILRLGPLIDPSTCFVTMDPPQHPPEASYAAPPSGGGPQDCRVCETDPPLNLYARLCALLISAQALNFLLGARNQCVRDRTVEFNPWSMESKGYKVFKVRQ